MRLKIEQKCTAVAWLVDQIIVRSILKENGYDVLRLLEDLSLQIEKEQIIKAFNEGSWAEHEKVQAEEYYHNTYGIE